MNDGGSAFPHGEIMGSTGMTRRDYIATHIAAGIAANPDAWANGSARGIAASAYEQADALLAESVKQ